MADTTILKYKVESWIRDTWLPEQPEFSGIKFTSCNLPLATGGEFEFDALIRRGENHCRLHFHQQAKPPAEKQIWGNAQNSICLFLLLAECEAAHRCFHGPNACSSGLNDSRNRKRVPEKIRFMHAQLPPICRNKWMRVWRSSSKEQGGAQ